MKMINTKVVKRCCKDFTKIENYEKAITDTQTWDLHHRLETHFSDGTPRPKNAQLKAAELIALDMYYHRPPEELIFMTHSEHSVIHHRNKVVSNEARRKLSNSRKGKMLSDETRRKLSDCFRGKHWKLIDGKRVWY